MLNLTTWFTDYLQPLTLWLHANPNWALLMTAFISFTESLAILGSIIPGSVTMTAIGILAGSGVMNISLTFLAATLGAVAGDSASYALGYVFSDHLETMWPFNKHPNWLAYGKDYFAQHGGKSVIIGRFFGPLRSIIPVIAGMMRMNQWYFLGSNVVSAIGWAMLYVMPGVLIGAASSELSAERATRLFLFVLLMLAAIWLATQGLRWVFRHASEALRMQLNCFWDRINQHTSIAKAMRWFTPTSEFIGLYRTENLLLIGLLLSMLSISVLLWVMQGTGVAAINQPCYFFLQSLRTQWFDYFFIILRFLLHPVPLFALAFAISLHVSLRNQHFLRYWLGLCIGSSLAAWQMTPHLTIFLPTISFHQQLMPMFPAADLTIATACFGFLTAYSQVCERTMAWRLFCTGLCIVLLFNGLAILYLGENGIVSVLGAYLLGFTTSVLCWLLFRRRIAISKPSRYPVISVVVISLIWLLTTMLTSFYLFKQSVINHTPHHPQFVLTYDDWWHQREPLLPIVTTNRIGKSIGLFNLQYLGTLNALETALKNQGWKQQTNAFFYALRLHASGKYSTNKLPLMTPLYLNHKPKLIMTYSLKKEKSMYLLRIWRSNYSIKPLEKPIWLGSVAYLKPHPNSSEPSSHSTQPSVLFNQLLNQLSNFDIHSLPPHSHSINAFPSMILPVIFLIKEKQLYLF